MISTPRKINWENLQKWANPEPQPKTAELKTISRDQLVKVGGLFRIRENYEPVWKMEAGEDGRSYIVRVGEEGNQERLLVSESDPASNYSKAAYRTITAGQVHVVWECAKCDTPNITKEGNTYECDQCHENYPDVLSSHPKPEVYDRAMAGATFGDWVVTRMKREGITNVHRNLIEVWSAEKHGEYQPKTGEPCNCKPGVQRDNCSTCEGTGQKIDFAAIRNKKKAEKDKCTKCGAYDNDYHPLDGGLCIDCQNAGDDPMDVDDDYKGRPLPEKEHFASGMKTNRRTAEEVDPPDEPGLRPPNLPVKKCRECGKRMSSSSVLSKCPKCIDNE